MDGKNKKEIVLFKDGDFPIVIKVVNEHSEVEKVYALVKTKNNGFMLQK